VDASGAKLPDHIAQQTVAEERLCLLTARGDQLSAGTHDSGGPTIDDLRGRSVIMPGRGTALRSLLDDAFAQVGFSPLPRFETNHPEMIRELVSAGLGVSIIPRSWLADYGPAVTSVELAQPLPSYRVALLSTTQPRIPARDRLVEHLLIALGS
jgi:DNA-binding transcriptional LysR family regulator